MEHVTKVRSIEQVTHDVLRIEIEKPHQYTFNPGQATEVAINKDGWQNEMRPFTFTCLPDDNYLEFTIKTYPSHKGVTAKLLNLTPKDELIIGDAWGTIGYKGEGLFIAGGAGITPFISIFRHLHSKKAIGSNKLIFANKTKADIINKDEFSNILGNNFINILSDEEIGDYGYGLITAEFLTKSGIDLKNQVYICGPPPMMEAVETELMHLNVDKGMIVKEEF